MIAAGTEEAQRFRLLAVDDDQVRDDFAAAVRHGLLQRNKMLPCRYLYDARGSLLFEEICRQPEYYLTRAEQEILDARAGEIAARVPPDTTIVELGAGSAKKTRTLFDAFFSRAPGTRAPRLRYVPIDISRAMLAASGRRLVEEYPRLEVQALAAEYRAGLAALGPSEARPKLVLWLGSNVGNFRRADAARFLASVRRRLGAADRLLMGVDLRKSPAVLEAAYDDAAGVTARFNRNLLARINRELDGEFDLERFAHRARWHERRGAVELALVSVGAQRVAIRALGIELAFADGEAIHTESSYKYSAGELARLAAASGLRVETRWRDDAHRFALVLLAPRVTRARRRRAAARGRPVSPPARGR
jgi:dimethylhistidine N-methyltransferase